MTVEEHLEQIRVDHLSWFHSPEITRKVREEMQPEGWLHDPPDSGPCKRCGGGNLTGSCKEPPPFTKSPQEMADELRDYFRREYAHQEPLRKAIPLLYRHLVRIDKGDYVSDLEVFKWYSLQSHACHRILAVLIATGKVEVEGFFSSRRYRPAG